MNPLLKRIRAITSGGQKLISGVSEWEAAYLRKEIEELIVMQSFYDINEGWTRERKKSQERQLNDYLQQGSSAVNCAASIMDDYGTVLARIAYGRA